MQINNKQVYSTVEFDSWAKRKGLIRPERFLFDKFLDPTPDTVEAGTAGGRILLELQRSGFCRLWGFDYVPEFIGHAKMRDSSGEISFSVMDATQLEYPDGKFGQAIYLQQIISCIETSEGRSRAAQEAYRTLRPGATALFSFLCFESRKLALTYKVIMRWIKALRVIRRSKRSIQYLPWLKHGVKINWAALLDREPYVYWFKAVEAEKLLIDAGFRIIRVGTASQIAMESMQTSVSLLNGHPMRGHIYFVCKK